MKLKATGHRTVPGKRSVCHRSVLLALAIFLHVHAQDTNLLRSILPMQAPVIKEHKMIYTFNFLFKECPAGNWLYYDSSNKQIIIEFYDTYVSVADTLSIKGQQPVKKVEIKNIATDIVPSKKKTQIIMYVKKQMNGEATCIGDTLRVVLWKTLEPKLNLRKDSKLSAFYLIPVIVAIATLLGVSFFMNTTR